MAQYCQYQSNFTIMGIWGIMPYNNWKLSVFIWGDRDNNKKG